MRNGTTETDYSARGMQQDRNLGLLSYGAGRLDTFRSFYESLPVEGTKTTGFIDDIVFVILSEFSTYVETIDKVTTWFYPSQVPDPLLL